MNNSFQLDYYYGVEVEQFSFFRVPRILIKDERFKGLSNDAKLLYGLMLDRLTLSVKNGWFDAENRAYIYYTVDNIMADLGCAREKCSKILKDLKGIGLIRKKRQGLGKPDIIYVMNFASMEANTTSKDTPNSDVSKDSEKQNLISLTSKLPDFENQKANSKPFEMPILEQPEDKSQKIRKSNPNYTNHNYNNKSNTDKNYIHLIHPSIEQEPKTNKIDGIEEETTYIELLKDHLDYEHHMKYDNWQDKDLFHELFEIICEFVCVKRKTVRIAGEDYPYELVKSKFLKLDSDHLQYVINCIKSTTTKIRNIKAYILTALYNASATIHHYYQLEMQHDRYGDIPALC